MANEERRSGRIYWKDVRLSFPHLSEPSASVKDGPKKFRASLINDLTTEIGKQNMTAAKVAVAEVSKEAWESEMPPRLKQDRKCIYRGEDLPDKEGKTRDGYADMFILKANNKDRPLLTYKNKTIIETGDISRVLYPGCRVEALVTLFAITDQDRGGNAIFAALEAIRFWADDETFGRQGVDLDDFDDYDDDAVGKTGDFGDDIPW